MAPRLLRSGDRARAGQGAAVIQAVPSRGPLPDTDGAPEFRGPPDSDLRRPAEGDRPCVSVEQVSHAFTTRRGAISLALNECALECSTGQFVSIIGPSGCGKTTLLRIIGGLIEPSRGSVSVGGRNPTEKSVKLGMVFQQPVLLPWRSALDNIRLPSELRRDRSITVTRARKLLEMVGLAESANKFPHELSGGMQQRISLCRALASDPELLLMDEPFGALDALTRSRLDFELARIWEETHKTVFFVTHSVPEAVLLSDRVIAMSGSPGSVMADVAIDLPRPRIADMRYSADFIAYERELGGYLGADVSL